MKAKTWTRIALVLVMVAASGGKTYGQQTPDLTAILKNLPTQIPELPEPEVRSYQKNTDVRKYESATTAIYRNPATAKATENNQPGVEITIYSYASEQEAERGVKMMLHIQQIAPTATLTTRKTTMYKWDSQATDPRYKGRESHRITSRVGLYVVTVGGTSDGGALESLVSKAYASLVQQLETS